MKRRQDKAYMKSFIFYISVHILCDYCYCTLCAKHDKEKSTDVNRDDITVLTYQTPRGIIAASQNADDRNQIICNEW